tara:strand:+ start:57 stop:233 length:177 start_codon:yes stop_codon:yes gene_type:complete
MISSHLPLEDEIHLSGSPLFSRIKKNPFSLNQVSRKKVLFLLFFPAYQSKLDARNTDI